MRVLIIEPRMQGHHGIWIDWLARGLMERGLDVTIGTVRANRGHKIVTDLENANPKGLLTIVDLPLEEENGRSQGVIRLVKSEYKYWLLFNRMLRAARKLSPVDVVFVPYLDYCVHLIGLVGSPFGRLPWSGVIMRPTFHYQRVGVVAGATPLDRVKKASIFRLLCNRTLLRCFSIDELLVRYLHQGTFRCRRSIVYLPDPVATISDISKKEAKAYFGIPMDCKVVLVYGALTYRKGIDALLEAVGSPTFDDTVHVLVVGCQDAEVRKLLSSVRNSLSLRIHQRNSHVTQEEEMAAFKAADCVWMGYRQHYQMSGVLVQAGVSGVPVLACEEGLIGYYTKKYGNGLVVKIADIDSVINALMHILKNPGEIAANAREARNVYRKHDVKSAVESIANVVSGAGTI
ncbi:MAG: glycosyltransferase [Thiogranum sp.]|nr:glycosyltransferase [Thiogranum sp.]